MSESQPTIQALTHLWEISSGPNSSLQPSIAYHSVKSRSEKPGEMYRTVSLVDGRKPQINEVALEMH